MLWFDPFAQVFTPPARGTAFLPAADVTQGDGNILLTLDLPGLTADDLEIEMLDGYLFVRGERRRPRFPEGTAWVHSERGFGRFERRIRVPDGVDPDGIVASMENGVLSLIVPKPERLRPRAIEIETGGEQRRLETANA
jgi:HSP20 family protein